METRQQANVQLNISIPRAYHDLLVTLAARKNLENPRANSTKGGLAKEILCEHLNEIMKNKGEEQHHG